MRSKITCNPNFHSGGMFEGRIQEGLSSGGMSLSLQGWLDALLRGSKSSFSSYINGSTANFQEGLSMSVDKRDFTFTKRSWECLCIQLNNLDKILMMFSCNVCVCMFLRQRKFNTYADNLMPGIVLEP
ncbi:hypothetical protein ACE6H2_007289 [Prunus campanulata]